MKNLTTQRLTLRPFEESDLPAVLSVFGDEEVNTFLPWFPLKTMEDAALFYQDRLIPKYGYVYAICLNDAPIGEVHAETVEGHDLGYALAKAHWGRGFAAEAAAAVIEQARRDGVSFLTATHDVNNPRSGAVMRKIGMRYCYSYLEQWQPKDFPVVFRMYQINLDGQEDQVYRGYWDRHGEHWIERLSET